jgi:hypothetical protein
MNSAVCAHVEDHENRGYLKSAVDRTEVGEGLLCIKVLTCFLITRCKRRMSEQIVNDEMRRLWKETVSVFCKMVSEYLPARTKYNQERFQYNLSPDTESNLEPSEYRGVPATTLMFEFWPACPGTMYLSSQYRKWFCVWSRLCFVPVLR